MKSSAPWQAISRAIIGVVAGTALLMTYAAAGDGSNGQLAFAAFADAMLVAGLIAGSWWAWVLGPLILGIGWASVVFTRCPGCGEGGEPLEAGAVVMLFALGCILAAILTTLGAALAKSCLWYWRKRGGGAIAIPAALVYGLAVLAVVGGIGSVLAVKRANENEYGTVVLKVGDATYRSGKPWRGEGGEDGLSAEEVRSFEALPIFWLGETHAGFDLVRISTQGSGPRYNGAGARGTSIYGHCTGGCNGPLQIQTSLICSDSPRIGGTVERVLESGAVVELTTNAPQSGPNTQTLYVLTGSVEITIRAAPFLSADDILGSLSSPNGGVLGPPDPQPCPGS